MLVFPVEPIPQVAPLIAIPGVLLVHCHVQVIGWEDVPRRNRREGAGRGRLRKANVTVHFQHCCSTPCLAL